MQTVKAVELQDRKFPTPALFEVKSQPEQIPGWGRSAVLPSLIAVHRTSGGIPGYPCVNITATPRGGNHQLNYLVHNDVLLEEIKEYTQEQVELLNSLSLQHAVSTLMAKRYHAGIGADPEIFITDGKGELIPAFELFPEKKGTAVGQPYWDGYQAEFNVYADTCMDNVCYRIQNALAATRRQARKVNSKANLTMQNVFDIPEARLNTDDKKYVSFGCTPSFSVYGETFPEVDAKQVPFRSAGGHLHLALPRGKDDPYTESIVKELDRILGVISVAMFAYYDSPRRRVLYGRAGEYRKPAHGLEYRVLSNAWLCHPVAMHTVYEIARLCMGMFVQSGKPGPWVEWDVTEDEARQCINTCDVDMAKSLIKRNDTAFDILIRALPTNSGAPEHQAAIHSWWKDMLVNGIHTVLDKPDEPSSDWRLHTDGEHYNRNMSGVSGSIGWHMSKGRLKQGFTLEQMTKLSTSA
jgi:hypothetical protein